MVYKEETLRKTLIYLIEEAPQQSDERTSLCRNLLSKKKIDPIAIKETLDKIKTSSPSSRAKLISFQVILEGYLTESEDEGNSSENKNPQVAKKKNWLERLFGR